MLTGGNKAMAQETNITQCASKILDVLIEGGAVAGYAIKVEDLIAASELSDSGFDRADTYLLQAGYIDGTMGGRNGVRWLTPAGIELHQATKASRPSTDINATHLNLHKSLKRQ
jgi:hypothetical protein